MLKINIKNVEELIFYNNRLKNILPDFDQLFKQWAMGKRFPKFKNLSQKSLLQFLDLIKDKHIKILEKHFDSKIKIEKLDYKIAKNLQSSIKEIEKNLCAMEGFADNFSISRKKDQIYISFWR